MTRGTPQINEVYANLANSEGVLPESVQWRIYRYAKQFKDTDLAAGLAKRADIVKELDDQLSNWGAAKIQASWYMRPGRDKDSVRAKISKEDRVTVLEVIAEINGLDPVVYEACAKHCVVRVALPLMSNPTAGKTSRQVAARLLAKEYSTLSYEKRNSLTSIVANCGTEIAEAFLCEMQNLRTVVNFLNVLETINSGIEKHVLKLTAEMFEKARTGRETLRKSGKGKASVNTWDEDAYPMQVSLVTEALQVLTKFPAQAFDERQSLLEQHVEFAKALEKGRLGKFDNDVHSDVVSSIEHLGGSCDYTNSSIERIRNAKNSKEIAALLDAYEAKDEVNGSLLMVAISNPNLDLATALRIAGEARWHGVDVENLMVAKKDTYPIHVIGALMTAIWSNYDELIDRLVGVHGPKELWRAYVSASIAESAKTGGIDPRIFDSKHVDREVLPKLPFTVFSQRHLPNWLVTALGEYLEANLPDEAAWDGFEALAKSHLGTVEQLVKASRLTTRKR